MRFRRAGRPAVPHPSLEGYTTTHSRGGVPRPVGVVGACACPGYPFRLTETSSKPVLTRTTSRHGKGLTVTNQTEASGSDPPDNREAAQQAGASGGPGPSGPEPADELVLLRAAIDALPEAVLFVRRATLRVAAANRAACQVLEYSRDDLRGAGLSTIVADASGLMATTPRSAADPAGPGEEGLAVETAALRNRTGALVPAECRARVVATPSGEYLVLVARPIAEGFRGRGDVVAARPGPEGAAWRAPGDLPGASVERGALEGRDAVTGLPDRRQFEGRLVVALRKARCRGDYRFAVLFIDLDGFKAVNDAWGHLHGDRVLQAIGARLAGCIRPEDMVARFGGDEFTVLLDHLRGPSDAVRVAERIRQQLESPVEVDGRCSPITASIGIALSWHGYREPDAMLQDADRAMYRAKAEGKGHYHVWAP